MTEGAVGNDRGAVGNDVRESRPEVLLIIEDCWIPDYKRRE